ncbi:bifunctional 4-hydroxy-2-oxoglutarate aldolase/2-dehydro-3-deoxy-phosphogluconate aldolase [Thermodesulfobacteriota bacterium B35]
MNNWQTTPMEILGAGPVIPVMVVEDADLAVPLARALLAGGVRVLEITLRSDAAVEAIRRISLEVEGALVGAGTVVSEADLATVTGAGALFAISPGLTPALLAAAADGTIPLIPGISTVSELMLGMERGYGHFKFFPAGAAGGPAMLQAIAGPFPDIVFCPTGGVSAANYRDYLALTNVACVGGSWLAPADLVRARDWAAITRIAARAVAGAASV